MSLLLIPLGSASAQITIGLGDTVNTRTEWHRTYPQSYWSSHSDYNDGDHHSLNHDRRYIDSSAVYTRGYSRDSYGRSYYGTYPSHVRNRGLYFNLFGN